MVKKISSRLVYAVITFFLLTFFVFALSNMMKGNALDAQLAANPHMSKETYNALLHERGLDQPIPVRYMDWLTDFLHGDMGTCEQFDVPVSQILSQRIGPTLVLNFTALVLAVLEVLNEDYIKTARAKGVREVSVVIRHALRNALIPIITIIGLEVPYIIGGSVVLETIFAWPGVGSFLITSINARDFDPIMGITVVICVVVMLTSILLDFVYMFVDPRIAKEK